MLEGGKWYGEEENLVGNMECQSLVWGAMVNRATGASHAGKGYIWAKTEENNYMHLQGRGFQREETASAKKWGKWIPDKF